MLSRLLWRSMKQAWEPSISGPPLLPLSVNPYPPLPNICLHVPSRTLHWQYMFTYIILLRVSYSSLEARNIVPIFR